MRHGAWISKPQVWSFHAAMVGTAMTLFALVLRSPAWALGYGFLTVLAAMATRRWARKDPMPMPYTMRWILATPRPFQSARRLKDLLRLKDGERILEIGPGTGKHALPIATSLAPSGTLEVLDIQQEMLDHLMRRVARAGIANIVATQGNAKKLPYPDGRFDGAYLIGVLGEIPDKDTALKELHRVLKPEGCLVIGEILVDPDFIFRAELMRHLGRAGFTFEREMGTWWAYLARFRRV